MINIPLHPPVIPPLTTGLQRPLWSVMIPVYNCGQFLEETLESVLLQEIPEEEMQIEVVDDASTDVDVEALVNRIGKGRIKYFRQAQNVGSLRNFETCINRSRGKLIHLLHGDDKVGSGYYRKIEALFAQHPEAGAAFCRFRCIDENGNKVYNKSSERQTDGILQNWLLEIGERQRIQYVAITVRRDVYEKLGAFFGIVYGEDWEMWVRIARNYPVAYTPDMLAYYRKHSASISGSKFLKGEHLQDLYSAMKLIQDHLPAEKKQHILEKSKRYYAAYGLKVANELWHKLHDTQVIHAQIEQALNLSRNPLLYLMILKLQLKLTLYRLWRQVYRS
ncbi:glycosyltransferase family 2 protein [Botryobacter ruber]|uniref:glycosyltransferase family 2 protein n=1 Tax=Botryobacter ruber TaxID=2171629 RepID=UPI001F0B758B|nr:glycosyltransferase [Botryobacter ruber]